LDITIYPFEEGCEEIIDRPWTIDYGRSKIIDWILMICSGLTGFLYIYANYSQETIGFRRGWAWENIGLEGVKTSEVFLG
jgi:hypothetical protein